METLRSWLNRHRSKTMPRGMFVTMFPNGSMVRTSPRIPASSTMGIPKSIRTKSLISGPRSFNFTPFDMWAATGAKMSRPWNTYDALRRVYSLFVMWRTSLIPNISAAGIRRPLSGPTNIAPSQAISLAPQLRLDLPEPLFPLLAGRRVGLCLVAQGLNLLRLRLDRRRPLLEVGLSCLEFRGALRETGLARLSILFDAGFQGLELLRARLQLFRCLPSPRPVRIHLEPTGLDLALERADRFFLGSPILFGLGPRGLKGGLRPFELLPIRGHSRLVLRDGGFQLVEARLGLGNLFLQAL